MDRSRPPLPHALLAGAVLLLAVLGWPVAAHAADRTVEVAGEGAVFRPADVTVHPGDTVTWVWVRHGRHTITFEDPSRSGGCTTPEVFGGCEGHRHQVTFEEVGEFAYSDAVTDASGVVRVVEPEPDPTTEDPPETEDPGSGGTDESEEPDGQQSTSPSADGGDDETTSASGADAMDDTGSGSSSDTDEDTDAAPRSGTSGSVGADVVDRQTPEATSEGPAVAAAEPDFLEEFPEPQAPTPSEDVGEVALPEDSGGAARTVWGTIGGLTLLGTIGAFGRVVLLADPWAG